MAHSLDLEARAIIAALFSNRKPGPATLDRTRDKDPRAYERWSEDEDRLLARLPRVEHQASRDRSALRPPAERHPIAIEEARPHVQVGLPPGCRATLSSLEDSHLSAGIRDRSAPLVVRARRKRDPSCGAAPACDVARGLLEPQAEMWPWWHTPEPGTRTNRSTWVQRLGASSATLFLTSDPVAHTANDFEYLTGHRWWRLVKQQVPAGASRRDIAPGPSRALRNLGRGTACSRASQPSLRSG